MASVACHLDFKVHDAWANLDRLLGDRAVGCGARKAPDGFPRCARAARCGRGAAIVCNQDVARSGHGGACTAVGQLDGQNTALRCAKVHGAASGAACAVAG